jgi:hypothetical protein
MYNAVIIYYSPVFQYCHGHQGEFGSSENSLKNDHTENEFISKYPLQNSTLIYVILWNIIVPNTDTLKKIQSIVDALRAS